MYQKDRKIRQNGHKICTSNGCKIFQMAFTYIYQGPPKETQIVISVWKIPYGNPAVEEPISRF
jgi:hypothetical protein